MLLQYLFLELERRSRSNGRSYKGRESRLFAAVTRETLAVDRGRN